MVGYRIAGVILLLIQVTGPGDACPGESLPGCYVCHSTSPVACAASAVVQSCAGGDGVCLEEELLDKRGTYIYYKRYCAEVPDCVFSSTSTQDNKVCIPWDYGDYVDGTRCEKCIDSPVCTAGTTPTETTEATSTTVTTPTATPCPCVVCSGEDTWLQCATNGVEVQCEDEYVCQHVEWINQRGVVFNVSRQCVPSDDCLDLAGGTAGSCVDDTDLQGPICYNCTCDRVIRPVCPSGQELACPVCSSKLGWDECNANSVLRSCGNNSEPFCIERDLRNKRGIVIEVVRECVSKSACPNNGSDINTEMCKFIGDDFDEFCETCTPTQDCAGPGDACPGESLPSCYVCDGTSPVACETSAVVQSCAGEDVVCLEEELLDKRGTYIYYTRYCAEVPDCVFNSTSTQDNKVCIRWDYGDDADGTRCEKCIDSPVCTDEEFLTTPGPSASTTVGVTRATPPLTSTPATSTVTPGTPGTSTVTPGVPTSTKSSTRAYQPIITTSEGNQNVRVTATGTHETEIPTTTGALEAPVPIYVIGVAVGVSVLIVTAILGALLWRYRRCNGNSYRETTNPIYNSTNNGRGVPIDSMRESTYDSIPGSAVGPIRERDRDVTDPDTWAASFT